MADVKTSSQGGKWEQTAPTYVAPVVTTVSPQAGSKDVTGCGTVPAAKPGK